jgi:hypothetical protein
MKSPAARAAVATAGLKLTSAMRVGLGLLLQAHDTALRLSCDKWDFAYEIQALKEAGLNHNDLRSLICQGLVEHAQERNGAGAELRIYCPVLGLRLHVASCFVLSERGVIVTRQMPPPIGFPKSDGNHQLANVFEVSTTPTWDRACRELRFGKTVVKPFRQPAKNQETILAAFQEDGWPSRIDDPLTGDDRDAQDRLRGAVKKLNRQAVFLIHFLSDGMGQGVLWQLPNPTLL